ncbi:hypothetical protein [Ottowia sp.]|uniref:hypothetical protein n=1 Tax=Ottowia sp. TaxID=1898956 RepID=UPI003963B822
MKLGDGRGASRRRLGHWQRGGQGLGHCRQLALGALFHAERRPSTLTRSNVATTQGAAFWRVFERTRDGLAK